MPLIGCNRRGERVFRTGQTGDRVIAVVLVIVIGAGLAFIGVEVSSEVESSTDLPASTQTVTNESTGLLNFSDTTNDAFYTVNKQGDRDVDSFNDDENVFNTSQDEVQLTEDTDYFWFPANGTLKLVNTTANQDAGGDPNGTYSITYSYEHRLGTYNDAQNNVSGGFTDAMSLIDIVFIVLMFSVILGALMAFRVRT